MIENSIRIDFQKSRASIRFDLTLLGAPLMLRPRRVGIPRIAMTPFYKS